VWGTSTSLVVDKDPPPATSTRTATTSSSPLKMAWPQAGCWEQPSGMSSLSCQTVRTPVARRGVRVIGSAYPILKYGVSTSCCAIVSYTLQRWFHLCDQLQAPSLGCHMVTWFCSFEASVGLRSWGSGGNLVAVRFTYLLTQKSLTVHSTQ